MKRFFIVMMLLTALTANAQTAKTETQEERIARLQKAAEANPADWQTRLELARLYLDEDGKNQNVEQAVKYYGQIFQHVADVNKEIPDSAVFESGLAITADAFKRQDVKTAFASLTTIDYILQTRENTDKKYVIGLEVWNYLFGIATENPSKGLASLVHLRQLAAQDNTPGIEYTDAATAMTYEMVLSDYMDQFGDKLFELTLDGKKYIPISMKDWNIEKPICGFLYSTDSDSGTNEKKPTLLYGEDGKVYDDIHGGMSFDFRFQNGRIEPNSETNTRMITVSPERRQQMVEAYRAYVSKK